MNGKAATNPVNR